MIISSGNKITPVQNIGYNQTSQKAKNTPIQSYDSYTLSKTAQQMISATSKAKSIILNEGRSFEDYAELGFLALDYDEALNAIAGMDAQKLEQEDYASNAFYYSLLYEKASIDPNLSGLERKLIQSKLENGYVEHMKQRAADEGWGELSEKDIHNTKMTLRTTSEPSYHGAHTEIIKAMLNKNTDEALQLSINLETECLKNSFMINETDNDSKKLNSTELEAEKRKQAQLDILFGKEK